MPATTGQEHDVPERQDQAPSPLPPPHPPRTTAQGEKPLICSFFRRQTSRAMQQSLRQRGSVHGRPSPTGGQLRVSQDMNAAGGIASCGAAGSDAESPLLPNFPAPMEDAFTLLPLTPSVQVPVRTSKRSGRALNESETLQEKHAQEYRYLVPMLAYAIECTIAEHEELRRAAGLPAYVPPANSPDASLAAGASSSLTKDRTPAGEIRRRTGKEAADGGEEAAVEKGSNTSGSSSNDLIHSHRSNGTQHNHHNGNNGVSGPNYSTGSEAFHIILNSFSTHDVPPISVHDYLKRIVKYTYVSPSVLVCCCLYLDRLLHMYPCLLIHPHNVFKLLITSTRVSSKIMDTRTLNNRDFSVVGGVSNEDLNALEFMFVQLLQNHLYISRRTFDVYCGPLRQQAAHVDASGAWEGNDVALVIPINGGAMGGFHSPSRPSMTRPGLGMGNGATNRSRRSSTVSQNEYSISMASQSGVSPLRSASRPAFPPSVSTAHSISVDADSLATGRQSGAPSSRAGSAATPARRGPTVTAAAAVAASRSPVLPQVHTARASSAALPPVTPSASALDETGSGDASSCALPPSRVNELMGCPATVSSSAGLEDSKEQQQRARSIPLTAPRGAGTGLASSWDTNRSTRALGSTLNGMTASKPNGSSSEGRGTSASSGNGERTPPLRGFGQPMAVALPPVPISGRRGRSEGMAVPLPPEGRSRP